MALIDFHYIKTGTGELSGPSFVAQTEQAINELGGLIENTETAATNATAAAAQAQQTATTAQQTANSAASQAQSAQASANAAQQSAEQAQSTADNALQSAQNAEDLAGTKAPAMHASTSTTYGSASDTLYGHVQLSDATDGTQNAASGGTAATPHAVAQVMGAAQTAQNAAASAQQAAQSAQQMANQAQSTAETAQTTADSVQTSLEQSVDNFNQQIAALTQQPYFQTQTTAINAQDYAGQRTKLYLESTASTSTGLPGGITYPCHFWADSTQDGNTSVMFVLSGNVLYSQSGVNTTPDDDTPTWSFTGWQKITYSAATTAALGVVKPDGTTVEVTPDGTLSINTDLLSTVYKFKGSVATMGDLPAGATQGDVYNVTATDANYAWTGSAWDNIGGIEAVDSSPVQNSTNPVASGGVYTALENLQEQITADTVPPTSTLPLAAGTATVGVENAYARGDHVHPAQAIPEYEGATDSTAGTSGLVPAAAAGSEDRPLRGDGTWAESLNCNITGNAATANALYDATGKHVDLQELEDMLSIYLPIGGGTMTGPLTIVDWMIRKYDASGQTGLQFFNPTDSSAYFWLNNTKHASSPGGFMLAASNGSTTKRLQGEITGKLLWDSKNIVRSVNGINAGENGNVSLSITPTLAYYKTPASGTFWQIQAPTGGTYAFLIIQADLTIKYIGTVAGGTLMTQPVYTLSQNDIGIFWRVA